MSRLVIRACAAALVAGCGASSSPPPATGAGSDAYPGVLHLPSELSPDFVVRQHLEVTKGDQHGGLDVVLQKRAGALTMVGLGPLGIRAFVLRQVGDQATLEQTIGPPLPFPPRNVLIDVHRAFFKRLPAGEMHGVRHGTLDGEEVTEVWDGDLKERRFVRGDRKGAVRVVYGAGCASDRCAPATIRIVNEWFGYSLDITNESYTFL